jgi:hypothetical protein
MEDNIDYYLVCLDYNNDIGIDWVIHSFIYYTIKNVKFGIGI